MQGLTLIFQWFSCIQRKYVQLSSTYISRFTWNFQWMLTAMLTGLLKQENWQRSFHFIDTLKTYLKQLFINHWCKMFPACKHLFTLPHICLVNNSLLTNWSWSSLRQVKSSGISQSKILISSRSFFSKFAPAYNICQRCVLTLYTLGITLHTSNVLFL